MGKKLMACEGKRGHKKARSVTSTVEMAIVFCKKVNPFLGGQRGIKYGILICFKML